MFRPAGRSNQIRTGHGEDGKEGEVSQMYMRGEIGLS